MPAQEGRSTSVLSGWYADWYCICGLVLYVYFVVRVIRTSEISTAGKVAWIIALSAAGLIAIPVAWWNVVRPAA